MRTTHIAATTLVGAAAMAIAAVVSMPSAAAETAQETIDRLQAAGYTVTIDKIGTAPISQCMVTSIRNPQTTSQLMPFVAPGMVRGGSRGSVLLPQVTSQTVSVSLDCSGGGTAH
jgi:hypothetical protein